MKNFTWGLFFGVLLTYNTLYKEMPTAFNLGYAVGLFFASWICCVFAYVAFSLLMTGFKKLKEKTRSIGEHNFEVTTIYCHMCGNGLDKDSNFCTQCGQKKYPHI